MGHHIKLRIDKENLNQLLKGKMIKINGIELFIADIGYDKISAMLQEIMNQRLNQ